MAYTVKKLAKLSGVSVRTLHFYDEMGLLNPASYGENGYRYYEMEQLLALQQILFFKELGFPLGEIKRILEAGDFDKIETLQSHRKVLSQNALRTKKLLLTLDQTISHLKGETLMSDQELYAGFDPERQNDHEREIIERFGSEAAKRVAESKANTRGWKKEDYEAVKREHEELNQALVAEMIQNSAPDSPAVQALVERHYAVIGTFYRPTRALYAGLGQLYVDHPEFRKFYDRFHPLLAGFLAEAMKAYAERELK